MQSGELGVLEVTWHGLNVLVGEGGVGGGGITEGTDCYIPSTVALTVLSQVRLWNTLSSLRTGGVVCDLTLELQAVTKTTLAVEPLS